MFVDRKNMNKTERKNLKQKLLKIFFIMDIYSLLQVDLI